MTEQGLAAIEAAKRVSDERLGRIVTRDFDSTFNEVVSDLRDARSEIRNLRTQLATAKAEGAAEWHEREAERLRQAVEEMTAQGECPIVRRRLKSLADGRMEIAVEIRKELK